MLLFSSAYIEYTVISKEYTGPLYFDITGVDYSNTGEILILIHTNKSQMNSLNRICINTVWSLSFQLIHFSVS